MSAALNARALGASDLQTSVIGLGCNNLGHIADDAAGEIVRSALDGGVTFFDTADVYADGRSEQTLGRWLAADRPSVIIATKFGHPAASLSSCRIGSKAHVFAAAEASLRRLGTDWIDLFQMHFPSSQTPIDETLDALDELIVQGKIRFAGSCNFSAGDLMDVASLASDHPAGFISTQNEYNLLSRSAETGVIPAASVLCLGFLPFFPLASGLLTGKYSRDRALASPLRATVVRNFEQRFLHGADWTALQAIQTYCEQIGRPMNEVAINWLLAEPAVASVICGASSADQLRLNLKAAEWCMTAVDRLQLRALVEASAE